MSAGNNAADDDGRAVGHEVSVTAAVAHAKPLVSTRRFGQRSAMEHASIKNFCESLPGACYEQPFGPGTDVWKVGGKIFAMSAQGSGRVSLKCADDQVAEMLISVGRAGTAPYLPRGGWIALAVEGTDEAEMKERLMESYQTVRDSLPQKVQAALNN
jgi:predicted DNA-binding protein (MmcQ/YjbR family)